MRIYYSIIVASAFMMAFFLEGCNKIVSVSEPINTLTASETFSSDANATSAVMAIYSTMSYNGNAPCFSNFSTTSYAGVSADELNDVYGIDDQFLTNTVQVSNGDPFSFFWQPAYYDIYMANAVIEGLPSSAVTPVVKSQLLGEVKFIRAFCYFYLTNLFGDIPLELSTDALQTSLLKRSAQGLVYRQIIADLRDAQTLMINDYAQSGGEHIRACKWAATALLARVYLYTSDWAGADSAATAVINSGAYTLAGLDSAFLKNNSESILQLQTIANGYDITEEARNFVPPDDNTSPTYFLTTPLLGAFERGDQRYPHWVDSVNLNNTIYYYPHKYKIGMSQSDPNNITEYYTLLRLGEQFLIRAEARAEENVDLPAAVADLNVIRERAGLPDLPVNSLDQRQVLAAVEQERRIELFAEWGHRWFDLKRWGTAVSTLDTISYKAGHISNDQLLWPIPLSEIEVDPELTQNHGY